MGVLDDAIREHLELKRKHGASEGEVEQQEQEALGAPRGRSAEAPEGEAVGQEPAVEEPDAPQVEEELAPEEPAYEAEVDDPAPEAVEAPRTVEPELAEEPQDDEPDWDFEPEPAEPPADPEPEAGGDTPPRGFDRVEDVAPPADGDDEEDVLEETPDFLQETPEHDRLWFEQKPPRDFDFDDDK
jgi:hypothetical protein